MNIFSLLFYLITTCSCFLPVTNEQSVEYGQMLYPVKNFENRIRSRRSYADFEQSVSAFLDEVDFYLEKIGIIRYIILDCRWVIVRGGNAQVLYVLDNCIKFSKPTWFR